MHGGRKIHAPDQGRRLGNLESLLTPHARRRTRRFGLSLEAIEAAMAWGRKTRQAHGRVRYHLGDRSVRRARTLGVRLERWTGVMVVEAADGAIITVGRYSHPKPILRKPRCQGYHAETIPQPE